MLAWTPLKQMLLSKAFLRSVVVSAAATSSDFVVANALARAGAAPALATFLGCAVGGVVAFSASRNWAFQANVRAAYGRTLPQIMRFLLVWGSSALLNSAGVPLLLSVIPVLGFAKAWLLVRGFVYTAWNFPLLRWFVFRPSPTGARASDASRQP